MSEFSKRQIYFKILLSSYSTLRIKRKLLWKRYPILIFFYFVIFLLNFNTINFFKGIITSSGGRMVTERLCSSGTRLDIITSPPQAGAQAGSGVKTSSESVSRALKSVSKQSLLGKNCFKKKSPAKNCKVVVFRFSKLQVRNVQAPKTSGV